jgi:hypothetical protein
VRGVRLTSCFHLGKIARGITRGCHGLTSAALYASGRPPQVTRLRTGNRERGPTIARTRANPEQRNAQCEPRRDLPVRTAARNRMHFSTMPPVGRAPVVEICQRLEKLDAEVSSRSDWPHAGRIVRCGCTVLGKRDRCSPLPADRTLDPLSAMPSTAIAHFAGTITMALAVNAHTQPVLPNRFDIGCLQVVFLSFARNGGLRITDRAPAASNATVTHTSPCNLLSRAPAR